MNLTETCLTSDTLFSGRILHLQVDTVALANGATSVREVIRHPGGVCIAALTDDMELLFVRQFRYPYAAVLRELPAGKLDPDEDPAVCAARELKEETGAVAGTLTPLGVLYPTVGYTDEVIHLFYATNLTFGEATPDQNELLEIERIPLTEAVALVEAGALPDAKTQTLILRVARLHGV